MRPHRLTRLTRLTHGVALVGLGLAEIACGSSDPPVNNPRREPQTNAPTATAAIAPTAATNSSTVDIGSVAPTATASTRDAGRDAAQTAAVISTGPTSPTLNPPNSPPSPSTVPNTTPRNPVRPPYTNSPPTRKPTPPAPKE